MKTLTTIAIIISLFSLSSSVQLQTEAVQHLPQVQSGEQGRRFVEPVQLYHGNIKGQTVMIDYSGSIDPKATRVEFMIFFDIGDAATSALIFNFVRVQNTKNFHYNTIAGRSEGTYWNSYSESFQFYTDGTNKVTLSIEKSFGGLNHGVSLYLTSYYL